MCLLFTFLAILYLYTMCPDPVYSPAESSYLFLFKNEKKMTLFPPLSLCVQVACAVLQWTERALGPLDWSCCCEPPSVGDRAAAPALLPSKCSQCWLLECQLMLLACPCAGTVAAPSSWAQQPHHTQKPASHGTPLHHPSARMSLLVSSWVL